MPRHDVRYSAVDSDESLNSPGPSAYLRLLEHAARVFPLSAQIDSPCPRCPYCRSSMTASVGETYQPPTYSCGDCLREWIVERRAQTTAVTAERRARWSSPLTMRKHVSFVAPTAADPTVDAHALTTVNNALEALQKAFRGGDETPNTTRTRQRHQS